jgi:hypothetical protein
MSTIEMMRRLSARELDEVRSAENMFYTAQEIGHDPTFEEALRHYYANTGPHFLIIEFEVERPNGNFSHAA